MLDQGPSPDDYRPGSDSRLRYMIESAIVLDIISSRVQDRLKSVCPKSFNNKDFPATAPSPSTRRALAWLEGHSVLDGACDVLMGTRCNDKISRTRSVKITLNRLCFSSKPKLSKHQPQIQDVQSVSSSMRTMDLVLWPR